MIVLSTIQKRGNVTFPEFTGERIYMQPFTKREGLPQGMSRWQPTVDQMLEGIETDGPIFIMVDQKEIPAGTPQRRPGVHIDGIWRPASSWDTGGWKTGIGMHTGTGRHGTNKEQAALAARDGIHTQSLMLASDVAGCRAFEGPYEGECGEGGDFTHLDLDGLKSFILTPNTAWVGDAMTLLHESVPVARQCRRTLVRLNISNWMPA